MNEQKRERLALARRFTTIRQKQRRKLALALYEPSGAEITSIGRRTIEFDINAGHLSAHSCAPVTFGVWEGPHPVVASAAVLFDVATGESMPGLNPVHLKRALVLNRSDIAYFPAGAIQLGWENTCALERL
jgi:hypothetical protein